MVIVTRTYKLKPGPRERFAELFRTHVAPEHHRLGVKLLGPFLCVDDPDILFFMRGVPDINSRETLKESF